MNEYVNEYGPRKVDGYIRSYRSVIIWANRRTGSQVLFNWWTETHSNLTMWKELYSAVEKLGYTVNYEPGTNLAFSEEGMFGDVVKQYLEDKDINKLENTLCVILWHRPSFIILTEETNEAVMQFIIRVANDYHYSNLLLYRRNSTDRLMSHHYAKTSGNYTPKDWIMSDVAIKDFKPPPLDEKHLKELIDEEVYSRERNIIVWKWFSRFGSRYASASYEDLFASNVDSSISHMTFRWLFYNMWDFTALHSEGKSGTDKYYSKSADYKKIENELKHQFRPTFANMHVEV